MAGVALNDEGLFHAGTEWQRVRLRATTIFVLLRNMHGDKGIEAKKNASG